jgi:hypothetical protein
MVRLGERRGTDESKADFSHIPLPFLIIKVWEESKIDQRFTPFQGSGDGIYRITEWRRAISSEHRKNLKPSVLFLQR